MDELDNRRMSLRLRSESRERRRDFILEKSCSQHAAGAAKYGYDALNMCNVFRKIPRREGDVAEEGQWRRVVELRLQFSIALSLHQLHLQGTGASSTGKSKGAVNSLKSAASGLTPAKREANSSLREATYDTNASVRLHVIGYTGSNQLRLPQSLYLEGGDVCVLVCYEDVFALQLNVEGLQVCSDVRQQD